MTSKLTDDDIRAMFRRCVNRDEIKHVISDHEKRIAMLENQITYLTELIADKQERASARAKRATGLEIVVGIDGHTKWVELESRRNKRLAYQTHPDYKEPDE